MSLLGLVTCLVAAADAPPAAAAASEPVTVKVGIYVLNVGKFDLLTGSYTVDFYLDMTTVPAGQDMGDAKFEFINGRATSTDKLIDTPGEKFYRVQANLQTNVDMRLFPWDSHDLPIIIEPANRGKKSLVYVLDEAQSGVDPDVTFVGWNLLGQSARLRDHEYKVYGETYSQYVYTLSIGRLKFMSTLKTFVPVLVFLLISMVSLLVALEKLDSRVGLNTAMLIASVMFHMSISAQMPPAGYLTIADKVMIATYGSIGINLLFTVQLMRMMQQKRDDAAKAFRELCFKLMPGIAGFAYLIVVASSLF
ncbi:MAG: hypothetical protein JNK82_39295 [Myxococcaceae bacterium]|nr:hypothetical protein [Myxococcaceae bacterium]